LIQHKAPTIETERLILRLLTPDDLETYHAAVAGDPDVMRYLPGGVPRPIERTAQSITAFALTWQDIGISGLGVVLKAENRVIGQCGLWRLPDGETVEIFYAIGKAYWGQGLVTEAARAMLAYGFNDAGLEQIIALAWPDNKASQRVMQKLGMTHRGTTDRFYNDTLVLYTLDRADWQAANTGR
jgi:ribosomal-protein-alanine N-acetyltransferase